MLHDWPIFNLILMLQPMYVVAQALWQERQMITMTVGACRAKVVVPLLRADVHPSRFAPFSYLLRLAH